MVDENIVSEFEKLNVTSKHSQKENGKQQRIISTTITNAEQPRNPLKVTISNIQLQQQQHQQSNGQNSSGSHRPPSMLIRKASIDRLHRIPSVVRKPSMDRVNGVNSSAAVSASGLSKKPSIDLGSRVPTVVRKGSLDGLSVNLNPSKRVVSTSGSAIASTSNSSNHSSSSNTTSSTAASKALTRHVDIGTYDGSLERDEKRGRRSNDVRGGLLDLDARQLAVTQQKQWSLLDFELGHPLGKGKFGRVFVARTKAATGSSKPGYIIALKALYKDEIRKEGLELQVRRELEIQMNLRHPHVLRLHGFFHDEGRIFMMLEFAGKGELYKIMGRLPEGHFQEEEAARLSAQMTDALAYLHHKNVLHRDIKPENILMDLKGDLKLADFGWSVHAPTTRRTTMCGTLQYLAPEMVERTEHDETVDLWSLGVLIYEFLYGSPPFEHENPEEQQQRIRKVRYTFPKDRQGKDLIPILAQEVISGLLKYKGSQRLPLNQVLLSSWVQKWQPNTIKQAIAGGYLWMPGQEPRKEKQSAAKYYNQLR